ncbi:MAG: indolepyruvate ferredoxin oxidoreductase family protein [Granulosicoccus sp.]
MQMTHLLEDKYSAISGQVFMNGTQALVRLPMAQMRRDRAAGLNTAAFVTGYRGSPLGAYDQQLALAQTHLESLDIRFQPGVNEDLAATAIWGTQQVPLSAQANREGVLGIWYGKGPGVDRCGDVFKHGNAAGSSKHGGVLCIAGDDHAAKSSTLPHQSDHAFMAAIIPMLYPSSIHEFIEVGLFGIAMSRYSGCWVGMKVISDTIETSAVVDISHENRPFVLPEDFAMPAGGLNLRWPDPPMVQDDRLQEQKAYAALAFARANKIDQVVIDSPQARLGIVASGKAFEDVRQAMLELGLDAAVCAHIGLRLYKVRMPWPLEPEGIRHFSEGLEEVLVVEERREIIENQIKQQLFNWRSDVRPRIVGKFDADDQHVLPLSMPLSASRVARAIAMRVLRLPLEESLKKHIESRLEYLQRRADERLAHVAPIERQPWFCSGCPHNTSTKIPKGSTAMAGIGCHYMVQWMGRATDTFTQMGGEGVPWTAISHFSDEKHRFVNLGDGTYFHSGLLAVRASVAAKVNITYKVLYNDAVAMTGGQSVDGELSPALVTWQLHAEGVSPIYVVTDDPGQFHAKELAPGVMVEHRDELDAVQRELRELEGCNAIVYVQTCAAEKRRRRKRGLLDDPDQRLFINAAVCEGCGDCSVQSNCISIEPLETAFGRKRRINQNSCNKDYSCVKGFCPSFVTVRGGQLKKRLVQEAGDVSELPVPSIPALGERPWNIAITGVGGTGVLTIGGIIGMAAHIGGQASMILDMAGLAQKGGAVLSHVRLAATPAELTSPHIVAGSADVLIAADDVVAASREGIVLCDASRTHAIVNTTLTPVAAFVNNRDLDFRRDAVADTIAKHARSRDHFSAFSKLAVALVGDSIATNIMMLGYAWQQSLVPLQLDALHQAIHLNGVAVESNMRAFNWGRRLAFDPASVQSLADGSTGSGESSASVVSINEDSFNDSQSCGDLSLDALVDLRAAHLELYQDAALAGRYRRAVTSMREQANALELDETLPRAVAQNYAKLLAYKDEYEVARLYSTPAFQRQLATEFEGDTRLAFHLAPPLLTGKGADGRPRKREFGPWVLKLFNFLQHGRRLRGTPMDVFGWSKERRAERQLIYDYESDLDRLGQSMKFSPAIEEESLAESKDDNALTMTGSRVDIAVAILLLPDAIRGFGPVKMEAMKLAEEKRLSLWQDYERPPAVDAGRAAA